VAAICRERDGCPEPRAGTHGAAAKHVEEDALHRAVCAHRIPLREAQAVTIDWTQPAAAQ
jgi:hypothetical protein